MTGCLNNGPLEYRLFFFTLFSSLDDGGSIDGMLLAWMNSAFICVNYALHLFVCRCSPTVFHGSPLYHAVTVSQQPAQRGRVKWQPGCRTRKKWTGVQKVSSCLGGSQSKSLPNPKLMEIPTLQPPPSSLWVTWPFPFLIVYLLDSSLSCDLGFLPASSPPPHRWTEFLSCLGFQALRLLHLFTSSFSLPLPVPWGTKNLCSYTWTLHCSPH